MSKPGGDARNIVRSWAKSQRKENKMTYGVAGLDQRALGGEPLKQR